MPVIGDRPELNLKSVIYATDFSLCSRNAASTRAHGRLFLGKTAGDSCLHAGTSRVGS